MQFISFLEEKSEKKMERIRSERHNKISGDFGEHFVCYWLSKRNFQPVIIDYTGIDIVAYSNNLGERWGISVKTRTRTDKKNQLESFTIRLRELPLISQACKFFNAKPYFGIVSDGDIQNQICIYIISLEDMKRINNYEEGKNLYIKLSEKYINQYETTKNSINIKIKYEES